jgi:Ca2+-binding EF-hand superfamily protein
MMNRNNSKMIGYSGFRKALNNYKLGLTDSEIRSLFDGFDVTHSEEVDYEEFLRIVKVIEECKE